MKKLLMALCFIGMIVAGFMAGLRVYKSTHSPDVQIKETKPIYFIPCDDKGYFFLEKYFGNKGIFVGGYMYRKIYVGPEAMMPL